MPEPVTAMREFASLDDAAIRRAVIDSGQPAVLRGLVEGWPIVEAGRRLGRPVHDVQRRRPEDLLHLLLEVRRHGAARLGEVAQGGEPEVPDR